MKNGFKGIDRYEAQAIIAILAAVVIIAVSVMLAAGDNVTKVVRLFIEELEG